MRIDVDHTDSGKNYRIPADNPFVDHAGVRPEIWAYGLRNPWRISFDRVTGDLWCGDVGWELWEMLHRIERGGNYGWSIMEGPQPINTELSRGPTPILAPVVQHSHTESSSITEGLTYYGKRHPELSGTHIYADYDTGKFWGIRYVDGQVVEQQTLADSTHRVVSFGEDRQGEFYFLDHIAGTIHTLEKNPTVDRKSTFPLALSQSGLFKSLSKQIPERGVIPYAINAEPWADHASSQRWVAIPNSQAINSATGSWSFPVNSVLVKTLSLEMRAGDADSRRAIETQLLHFDGQDWMPYTYRWNDEQTDAHLVGAAGEERQIAIEDLNAPGGKRLQHWQFAGRAECQRCHNKYAGTVLGFTPPQLNYRSDGSQLDHFAAIQLISTALSADQTPKLANPHDVTAPIDDRARAYLHANCGHCHRMSAGGSVMSYMHFDLPLEQTNLLGKPTQGDFGIQGSQVVAPGAPYRSVLPYRLAKLGGGRMPRLCSNEVDAGGFALVCNWIAQLPPNSTESSEVVGADNDRNLAQKVRELASTNDSTELQTMIEQLLRSTSGAMALLHAIDERTLPAKATKLTTSLGSRHTNSAVRDLFERFLAPDERVARLGSVVQPEAILTLAGDTERGRKLYFDTPSVSCKNCHRLEEQGVALGPDLSGIARKLNATQLLESILEPSKVIDPSFQSYLVATVDGQIQSGLLVRRDEQVVVLKNAANEEISIESESIEQMVPQGVSLMPELLVRDMTAQQVADLIAFLSTLKSATP